MALFSEKTAADRLDRESRKVDPQDIEALLARQQAVENKVRASGRLNRFSTDVRLMFSLIRDYWRGDYRDIPWKTIAGVTATLLYVLNPLDLLPDMIAGLGLLDDATIVAFCLKLAETDLHRYAAWKEIQQENSRTGN